MASDHSPVAEGDQLRLAPEGFRPVRLRHKVAIVTGAGSQRGPGVGVGRAIALAFAREGATVVAVDIDAERGKETQAQITAEGGAGSMFCGDLRSPWVAQAMVEAVIEEHGRVDVLVNNVAVLAGGTVVDTCDAEWEQVMGTNLRTAVLACRFSIPVMADQHAGSIVNISSLAAQRGTPSAAPYAASKGALEALTRQMAVAHGRQGIRVNAIAPGHIDTPMTAGGDASSRREASALGTEGTAWDVACAAVYLASDEARWITGITLAVDAGASAGAPLAIARHLRRAEQEGSLT